MLAEGCCYDDLRVRSEGMQWCRDLLGHAHYEHSTSGRSFERPSSVPKHVHERRGRSDVVREAL